MSRPHVVVVGNGMAGSRVVEDIRRQDEQRLVDLTVVGAELHAAYNRILLSEVLSGRQRVDTIALQVAGWHADNDVDVRLGMTVGGIDREARKLNLSDGSCISYDAVVLATGSKPWLPPIDGLVQHGALVPGAHAFRSLDDCHEIAAAAKSSQRAVVLGGGLLGIEAARGLAGHGIPTVVVHAATHLMERQLDHQAGRVLAKTLGELGINTRLNATTCSLILDRDGRFGGLALDDGSCILGDLLVVATGVRPETSLAVECGLEVARGVVVDDTMRSVSDPRVFAVGECASHRGDVYGLVAPAWEQARVVADQITGANPESMYRGSRLVTRLKAANIDLASLGDPFTEGDAFETVLVSDPGRGTYAKVVLKDERIVGAIVLGQVSGIGTLTTLFDRDVALPNDRLKLLLPAEDFGAQTRAGSPATMPSGAVVCKCNGVTKSTIQGCVLAGARSVAEVADKTKATTGCGGCTDAVAGIVDWINAADPKEPTNPTELLEVS